MNNQYLSNLYLSSGYALLFGNIPDTEVHSHHAMEIFIGLKKPVSLISEDRVYQDHVLLIRPDFFHLATATEDEKIIIILDTETTLAQKLSEKYLREPLKITF